MRRFAVLAACLSLVAAAPAAADEPSWVERVDLSGDIRLRYEGFDQEESFDDGRRDRFRVRLRAGIEVAVTDALNVGIQLRNGNPDDPVSNNTSFDGSFQFKEFNLAQAYLDARVTSWFDVIGGKFEAGKRWTVSDFQWDDDVTVEGVMESFDLASGDGNPAGVEIVAYQYLLEESGSGADAFVFGGQGRADLRFGSHHRLGLGAGVDVWDNPQAVADLTLDGRLAGNPVTNLLDDQGRLVSDFEVANLFAEWKCSRSERWPLKLNLFLYRNLGAKGAGSDEDTAFFARVQLGDYKSPGQVAVRYSRYLSEPDALFYVFTQSDTSSGSDVDGHRLDVRIGAIAGSYVNLTWYNVRRSLGEEPTLNRWQVDYIVRF